MVQTASLVQPRRWRDASPDEREPKKTWAFRTKDHSRNVWWLVLPSMGESWHNFHHAQPDAARHGTGRFEVDTSAVVISVMERLGWIDEVRWPDASVVARRRLVVAE